MVDVGVAAPLAGAEGLIERRVMDGTADMTVGPAMTRAQAEAAVAAGIATADELVAAGSRCLVPGDMGIANTTAAAALICVFTGATPDQATGRGTGVDDATLARKVEVVSRGAGPPLRRTRPIRWACWPRSAGWSTPRSPGSCSARRRTAYRSCSTA